MGTGIEADGVGDVVCFGGELQLGPVAEVPALGECRVNVEVAVSAVDVAVPGFSCVRQADGVGEINAVTDGRGRGGVEDVRNPVGDIPVRLDVAHVEGHGGVVVVGGI